MKTIVILVIFFVAPLAVHAQQVCISQEAANKCAQLADNEKVQTDKIALLEQALRERDKIIEDLKVKLAMETQRATDADAYNIKMMAVVEGLLKAYTKPKKWGLIVF